MIPTALNRRALDCAPLNIPLHQRLVTVTPIGNSYRKIDWPIWPIYGSVAGYLLRSQADLCMLDNIMLTRASDSLVRNIIF